MNRLLAPIAVAALVLLPSQNAAAQTNFSQLSQYSPTTTINYLPFTVTTAGSFTMNTSGLNNIDPMILLFSGTSLNGAGLGALLAFNDDGAAAQAGWNVCSGAAGTCHSSILSALGVGDYTLALGTYNLPEADARAGQSTFSDANYGQPYCNANEDYSTCNYTINITSEDGTATSTVPEPSTVVLVAAGMLGMGGLVRRRRNAPQA